VLAALLEKVYAQPWEELLSTRLLRPLGLSKSGHDTEDTQRTGRVAGYRESGPGLTDAEYFDMDIPIGAGDLYSSVDDLNRFVRAVYAARAPMDRLPDWVLTPEPILDAGQLRFVRNVCGIDASDGGGYAGGWFVGTQHGHPCLQHGGAIDGFSSSLAFFPEEDLSVVVLSNVESYEITLRAATEI